MVDVESIVKRSESIIISNFEIVIYYGNKGINSYLFVYGGKFGFDFGIVKYVNVIYISSFFDGFYGGQFGGFVIWNDEGCFYYVGDIVFMFDM